MDLFQGLISENKGKFIAMAILFFLLAMLHYLNFMGYFHEPVGDNDSYHYEINDMLIVVIKGEDIGVVQDLSGPENRASCDTLFPGNYVFNPDSVKVTIITTAI